MTRWHLALLTLYVMFSYVKSIGTAVVQLSCEASCGITCSNSAKTTTSDDYCNNGNMYCHERTTFNLKNCWAQCTVGYNDFDGYHSDICVSEITAENDMCVVHNPEGAFCSNSSTQCFYSAKSFPVTRNTTCYKNITIETYPTLKPSFKPSTIPSLAPSASPTKIPTLSPSSAPSYLPTNTYSPSQTYSPSNTFKPTKDVYTSDSNVNIEIEQGSSGNDNTILILISVTIVLIVCVAAILLYLNRHNAANSEEKQFEMKSYKKVAISSSLESDGMNRINDTMQNL